MKETKKQGRFESQTTSSVPKGGRFSNTDGTKIKKKVNYSGGYDSGGDNAYLWIVGFIFVILPLIVHAKSYNPKLATFDWFSAMTEWTDVFLYYKQWIFTILLFGMVACIAVTAYNGKRQMKFNTLLIPVGIYGVLSLLSTLCSKNSSFGFSGIYEQFENVFCLIGYVVLVYFVFEYVNNKKDVHTLLNMLAVGALIIGIIGMFQGLKLDFFRSGLGKSLIASAEVPASKIGFNFEAGRTYATLYNPNYVGVYSTLIIPIFTVLIPFAKNIKERILYIAVVVTMLFSMFAAQFKAGIVSLVFVGLVVLFLLRKEVKKKWFIVLPAIIGVIVLYLVVDTINGHVYSKSIKNAFTVAKTQESPLSEIQTKKDRIEFTYQKQTYYLTVDAKTAEDGTISYQNYKLTKKDGTKVQINQAKDTGYMYFADENLGTLYLFETDVDFTYLQDGKAAASYVRGFDLVIDGVEWKFVKRPEGFKYRNLYAKETVIETAQTALFDGYEDLASKRGFIWGRTIPLLKKYIILGSGADTFSIVFPQHDYVSAQNHGYGQQLISKPHCWYLQIGVQTGVLSLIAIIVFYGMYFVQSIRLYSKRNFDSYLSRAGVAVFVGTIGYMISGITNDSSITVAPVFWGVIALGVTINYILKQEEKVQK